MFNVLPLVTSDFRSTLYFVSCSVIVMFVGISLISAIAVWPYFLILFRVRNRFSIIMIMLPWGCSQHSSNSLFIYVLTQQHNHVWPAVGLVIDTNSITCVVVAKYILNFQNNMWKHNVTFSVNIHLEDCRLTGCYSVSSGAQSQHFKGTAILQNVRNCWPKDTA